MRVIHLIEHVGPFRIAPFRRRCASVLELPTRSIFGSGTQLGDEVIGLFSGGLVRALADERGGGTRAHEAGSLAGESGAWAEMVRQAEGAEGGAPSGRTLRLTAAYWNGAAPAPRSVRNIDPNGAFIESVEPWRAGTMIHMALEPTA